MIAVAVFTVAVLVVLAALLRFFFVTKGTPSNLLGISSCLLEPFFDEDFRSVNAIGYRQRLRNWWKGYVRPIGCQRYALKIAGEYDGGDDWMTNWRNAYCGTSIENARGIVRNCFDLGKMVRMAFGEGIYYTPDPETAKVYTREKGVFFRNGTRYLVVIQVRVDPRKCKVVKRAGKGPLKDGEYWTVPNGAAIRPYAICLFRD